MRVLIYVGAVLSHWRAAMGGIVALALATAVQWKWLELPIPPQVWWPIAEACFAVAMFQAWNDEYRERLRLQQTGPKIVLEHIPGTAENLNRWRIRNSGEADAVNIRSDEIRSYDVTAEAEQVPLLPKEQSAELRFRTRQGDNRSFGPSAHLTLLLNAVKKGAEKTTDTMTGYKDALANVVIPVRFTYADPRGVRFETKCEIR